MALVEASSEHDAKLVGKHDTTRDKIRQADRVITGMGVVTSLGIGKGDNWTKLPGESGSEPLRAFRRRLKTSMRNDRFLPVETASSTDLSERLANLVTEEAFAQSAIGTTADFRDRCFSRSAVEIECRTWSSTRYGKPSMITTIC